MKQWHGIDEEGGEGNYLGLPEVLKSSKVKMFSYIKDRMSRKFLGWHTRNLAQGGKEVLIKAVAIALPIRSGPTAIERGSTATP